MSKDNNFYISTTLPYTNAKPHIGFAAEILRADVIARYQRLKGRDVIFNTGTDEHGVKIQEQADKAGVSVSDYCQTYAQHFYDLKSLLNLSFTNFIRSSDKKHKQAAQKFWEICLENGDIYKKAYQVKYCVGCELEKTDSELQDGRCPLHPNRELELIDEENYFFRFSKYQSALLDFYQNTEDFVLPAHRFTEIKNFVSGGLKDFSISRLKSKMPNGVPVPGDDSQVMYVWFDALVNYISTLGWPEDKLNFENFWPALQVCGKDNLRQQSSMWQAMLMSAKLAPSKQILIFGFLTVDGQKISKSLGNSIDPFVLVDKFGAEALRYYLLSEISAFEDSDFSEDRLILKYNADLANGLGNLVARVSNLLEKNKIKTAFVADRKKALNRLEMESGLEHYQFNKTLQYIWLEVNACNEFLSSQAPWKMNDLNKIKEVLIGLSSRVLEIALMLEPFLPESSEKIIKLFTQEQVTKSEILFPRLNKEEKNT